MTFGVPRGAEFQIRRIGNAHGCRENSSGDNTAQNGSGFDHISPSRVWTTKGSRNAWRFARFPVQKWVILRRSIELASTSWASCYKNTFYCLVTTGGSGAADWIVACWLI